MNKIYNGGRVFLRKLEEEDREEYLHLYSNDDALKYLEHPILKNSEEAEKEIEEIKDQPYNYAICLKDTGKLCGRAYLHKFDKRLKMADIIWLIQPDLWGKGLMTEAGQMFVDFLHDEGFVRVEAFIDPRNLQSRRVLEKLGFEKEGTLRLYDMGRDGKLYDVIIFSNIRK